MAVNDTHPDYDFTLPEWLRARDVLAGEDAVKAGGVRYLPLLDSQSDEEYAANRAGDAVGVLVEFHGSVAGGCDGQPGIDRVEH